MTRHTQAHQSEFWLRIHNRGPVTANRIYQLIARPVGRPGSSVKKYVMQLSIDSPEQLNWLSVREPNSHAASGSGAAPYLVIRHRWLHQPRLSHCVAMKQ